MDLRKFNRTASHLRKDHPGLIATTRLEGGNQGGKPSSLDAPLTLELA